MGKQEHLFKQWKEHAKSTCKVPATNVEPYCSEERTLPFDQMNFPGLFGLQVCDLANHMLPVKSYFEVVPLGFSRVNRFTLSTPWRDALQSLTRAHNDPVLYVLENFKNLVIIAFQDWCTVSHLFV